MSLMLLAFAVTILFILNLRMIITSDSLSVMKKSILGITCILVWWFGFDLEKTNQTEYLDDRVRHLVSSSPPEDYLKGSFSLFMGTGGGDIETSKMYMLREQVEDNLYVDFLVKKKVYLKEDKSLPKDKGKFIQTFKCVNRTFTYRYLFFKKVKRFYHHCEYKYQTIMLPEGYVIKEIRGV